MTSQVSPAMLCDSHSYLERAAMSGCGRRPFGLWLASLLTVVLLTSELMAQPGFGELGTVGLVERLVRAAFPELDHRRVTVSLSFDHGTHPWRETHDAFLWVLEAGEGVPTKSGPDAPVPFLRGIFQFQDGGFDTVSFLGRHVHQADTERLAALFRATPTTARDVDAVLRKAGARFGPGERAEMETAIAQSQLLPLLGIQRLDPPEFVWPKDDSAFTLGWVVRAEGQSSDLRLSCYALWFEPFDGRLVRVRQWKPQEIESVSFRCSRPDP